MMWHPWINLQIFRHVLIGSFCIPQSLLSVAFSFFWPRSALPLFLCSLDTCGCCMHLTWEQFRAVQAEAWPGLKLGWRDINVKQRGQGALLSNYSVPSHHHPAAKQQRRKGLIALDSAPTTGPIMETYWLPALPQTLLCWDIVWNF